MTNIYDSLGINGGLNISANSTTDAIYISQLGTGNAVLIEDSSNPDASPFIINSGGSVNIGRIEYLSTSGGTQSKLQVNNSTSQIPSSGLPFTTNFIVQGFNNNNIGFFTTDINTSQLYFGTPSSVYGAKLSWRYTGGTFDLSTQTTGGTITFGTDQGLERMRIQSDGNVGIGTTAATSTLTVNGSLSATTLYGDGSNLTGISGGGSFTGGTVTGSTTFKNGLSANTFSSNTETIIGKVPTSASGSVSTGSAPSGIYVQGRYVYVVNVGSDSLQIFDVSSPSSPVLVGSTSTGSAPSGIYVQGRYAYVVNVVSTSLQIFDVSNPSSPTLVGTASTGSSPSRIYVQGRYAYVINRTSDSLQIFDVSNPSLPVSVGSVSTGSRPDGIYVQGRYVYVINRDSRSLQIFDVSNPSLPVSVGSVSTGSDPYHIYVQARYAYVLNRISSELKIFDVSNPSSPVLVGTASTGSGSGIYVQGRYAYVINGNDSLQIFDVSNPSSPVSVGSTSTGSAPSGIYVQGIYAYVVNRLSNSLQIFDVSGSYIQQLEVGGILTNTLESVGNTTIGNDLAVVGGLNVSQSTNIQGNLSATNLIVVSGVTSNTVSANTISATTYQNLPQTTSANTATIHFSSSTIFGSYSSPLSTNITDNLSGSKLGITQKIYHNSGTSPSVPAGWVLLGSTTYQTSVINIIYAEWSEDSRVEYWIVR